MKPNTLKNRKWAKSLSIEVWKYLSEHPDVEHKVEVPKILSMKIRPLRHKCSLCELYCLEDSYRTLKCPGCPLDVCNCMKDRSLYEAWCRADELKTLTGELNRRERTAKKILRIIQDWDVERGEP